MDDVSETIANQRISFDSVSEKSGSVDIIESQIRKASHEVTMDKVESEGERLESLSEVTSKVKEKQEEMDVL